jgi:hypothetical protein
VDVAQDARRKNLARPAPFSPEQVAALIAGKASEATIARVLAAQRQTRIPESKGRKSASSAPAPVALTAAQLRELGANRSRTPDAVAELLESTVPKTRRSSVKMRKSGARPSRRPPT